MANRKCVHWLQSFILKERKLQGVGVGGEDVDMWHFSHFLCCASTCSYWLCSRVGTACSHWQRGAHWHFAACFGTHVRSCLPCQNPRTGNERWPPHFLHVAQTFCMDSVEQVWYWSLPVCVERRITTVLPQRAFWWDLMWNTEQATFCFGHFNVTYI